MDRRAYRRSWASHWRSAEQARWRVDNWTMTCACADGMKTGSVLDCHRSGGKPVQNVVRRASSTGNHANIGNPRTGGSDRLDTGSTQGSWILAERLTCQYQKKNSRPASNGCRRSRRTNGYGDVLVLVVKRRGM